MIIPGYKSIASYAQAVGLTVSVVHVHLKNGYCKWPRRTQTEKLRQHVLYVTWENMIQRCHNPNNHGYVDYGGRGIQVYPAWRESRVFLKYCDEVLGPKPQGYSLDRIDNNRGYEPGNINAHGGWVSVENVTNPSPLRGFYKANNLEKINKFSILPTILIRKVSK